MPKLNELFIRTQPAHLQKLRGVELSTADRNIERARYLRRYLNREEDGNGGKKTPPVIISFSLSFSCNGRHDEQD